MRRLRDRLGLDGWGLERPVVRAWLTYDWANSAFLTTIISAVFPAFYVEVAAAGLPASEATYRYGVTTTVALALVAVLSPLLGALADRAPLKKKLLAGFMLLGVAATAAMPAIGRGDWLLASVLFAIGNIGVAGSFVFYDALLPHVARPHEIDRISTAGYALGYLGGGLLLAVNIAWILAPGTFGFSGADAAVRASFVSVAVWWLVFSLPLLRRVPEPPVSLRSAPRGRALWRAAFAGLGHTFRELRSYRDALLFLVAFLLYNDGIGTIIRMATAFGKEIGLPTSSMIIAIMIVQFVGIPCSVLFGHIAGRIGAKRAIFASLVVYLVITLLSYRMRTPGHFYALAALVGLVQGGSQALSRSLFASLVPAHKSAEFFAFFSVFEKFAGIFGPLLMSAVIAATGSSRTAILAIGMFFVLGGGLLLRVDVQAGQRRARAAEAEAGV
jgi:UMF1 family MFS transporter